MFWTAGENRRVLAGARAGYLNGDVAEHREAILGREFPPTGLWVFDEIHKYRARRGLRKGLYDGRRPGQRILVAGSTRLDLYRYGGDSLQGRYHLLRLHPLSIAELGLRSRRSFATSCDPRPRRAADPGGEEGLREPRGDPRRPRGGPARGAGVKGRGPSPSDLTITA